MLQQIQAEHCAEDDWLRFDFNDEDSNMYFGVQTDGSAFIGGYAIGYFTNTPEERFGCSLYMSYSGGEMKDDAVPFPVFEVVNQPATSGEVVCEEFTVSLNSMANANGQALGVIEEEDEVHGAGWVVPVTEPCINDGLVEKPFRDWIFVVGDCDDLDADAEEWVTPDCEDPDNDNVCSDVDTCPTTYDPSNNPDACSGTGRIGSGDKPTTTAEESGSAAGVIVAAAAGLAVVALVAGVAMNKKQTAAAE